jgi:hypothetical protein
MHGTIAAQKSHAGRLGGARFGDVGLPREGEFVPSREHRLPLRPVLLVYYVLALTCSPLNRLLFGDFETSVSVSYAPLVFIFAIYGLRLAAYGLDRTLTLLVIGLILVTGISVGHSISSIDPFLVKCPLFFLFAILVAANTTEADVRAITRVTYGCAVVYVCVGIARWYTSVYGELLTPASFSEAMFFKKQEYTVMLTLLAGMSLYELLLSGFPSRGRRALLAFQVGAVVIGMTLFYIKSLLVVIAVSTLALWLLGVKRARRYVVAMGLGLGVLYFTYERLILLGSFPEHVVAYVAWLFDDRLLTVEGARNLDTLTMRLAILTDNFEEMRQHATSMMFGIGTNTAANASFTSYLSGRERDLPVELESGLLQMFVYIGSVGLGVFLFSYLYAFRVWARARRRSSAKSMAMFSQVIAVNLALLASNIFQDNLASVTWYWLGLLWFCVGAHRRAALSVERPQALRIVRGTHAMPP